MAVQVNPVEVVNTLASSAAAVQAARDTALQSSEAAHHVFKDMLRSANLINDKLRSLQLHNIEYGLDYNIMSLLEELDELLWWAYKKVFKLLLMNR